MKMLRYGIIAVLLILGVYWSLAEAQKAGETGYPNADFLATAQWLQDHADDSGLVIVDVRTDKHFDDNLIPGAIRMPWRQFQYNDAAANIGGRFVGTERAQEILGEHGIGRNDTVVLYDDLKRDGGATSSYLFWVLDLLGHEKKKVLERGVEGWIDAGGDAAAEPAEREAVLYQAPADQIDLRKSADAAFLMNRLKDPYYQILDVRSKAEYLGQTPNVGLDGQVLKLGHMPSAYNVDYTLNWADPDTKNLKSYAELQQLYRGLDPNRAVVTYCHSGRRSSFSYFILRLMGFDDVMIYEPSWNEWGNGKYFYPVETRENLLKGDALPGASGGVGTSGRPSLGGGSGGTSTDRSGASSAGSGSGGSKSGYVSCGG